MRQRWVWTALHHTVSQCSAGLVLADGVPSVPPVQLLQSLSTAAHQPGRRAARLAGAGLPEPHIAGSMRAAVACSCTAETDVTKYSHHQHASASVVYPTTNCRACAGGARGGGAISARPSQIHHPGRKATKGRPAGGPPRHGEDHAGASHCRCDTASETGPAAGTGHVCLFSHVELPGRNTAALSRPVPATLHQHGCGLPRLSCLSGSPVSLCAVCREVLPKTP